MTREEYKAKRDTQNAAIRAMIAAWDTDYPETKAPPVESDEWKRYQALRKAQKELFRQWQEGGQ